MTALESDGLRSSVVSKNRGVREIGILLSFRFLRGEGGGYESSLSLLSIKEWAYDFAKSAYIVSGGRSLSFALFYLACRRHIIQALSKDDWEE